MTTYESMRTATIADRVATHERLAQVQSDVLEARRALARTYLQAHRPAIEIAQDRAVAVAPLIEESRAAREEAAGLAIGRS